MVLKRKCLCGSESHSRTSHPECELNKKLARVKPTKCSSCNRTGHFRKSSHKCPHNVSIFNSTLYIEINYNCKINII